MVAEAGDGAGLRVVFVFDGPASAVSTLFCPSARQIWRSRTDPSSCLQPSSHQEQVAECEQCEQMRTVFGQPTIAGLHMTELALYDTEGMLDLCTHVGDGPVDLFVDRVELPALGRLTHDAPDLAFLSERGLALGVDIALVGPDRLPFAVQQFIPVPAVMHLSSRGLEVVDGAAVYVHTDMGLHAKIPVIALLCGRHLLVPRLGLDLGRGWRVDHRRIRIPNLARD